MAHSVLPERIGDWKAPQNAAAAPSLEKLEHAFFIEKTDPKHTIKPRTALRAGSWVVLRLEVKWHAISFVTIATNVHRLQNAVKRFCLQVAERLLRNIELQAFRRHGSANIGWRVHL